MIFLYIYLDSYRKLHVAHLMMDPRPFFDFEFFGECDLNTPNSQYPNK